MPASVRADDVVSNDITFSDLQITSSSGTVQLMDSWTSKAFANALNSLGQADSHFDSHTGSDSTAAASVSFASASGTSTASSPGGTTSSNVNIAGPGAASSTGKATLANTFEITGGTGSVDVTFSTNISGNLAVSTDPSGLLAQTEAIFNLQLDGVPILFFDSPLMGGPSSSVSSSFSQFLSITIPLTFGTPYFVDGGSDSETKIVSSTPEPSTAFLFSIILLSAAAWWGVAAYQKRGSHRVF
jgi:hypothetical protein